MSEPRFVLLESILEFHESSIAQFGGDPGIRDIGLIESAIASAINTYLYANSDFFDIAASYAFHLSESQAFVDGNKRTCLKAAMAFLEINGVDTKFDRDKMYELIMAMATRQLDKTGLAAALREMATTL